MEADPIPIDELYDNGAEQIDGHGKTTSIIGSTFAIASFIASSALIWVLLRSKQRLSTIYHRIMFGMGISDILYSLSLATFNTMAPIDNAYYVWNVQGNQASCSAQGFVLFAGAGAGLCYSCSINFYYLAVVRYQKTDRYITSKIEPFLHGVPILFALIPPSVLLANSNINDGGGGNCYAAIYDPPHCTGYEDGEVRDGFSIPCSRGHDGTILFYYMMAFVTFFIVPCVLIIVMGIIYFSVRSNEKKIAKYGAGSLAQAQSTTGNNEFGAGSLLQAQSTTDNNERASSNSFWGRLGSFLSNKKSKKKERSNSRVVLQRAMAYTGSFFLTWTFFIIGVGFDAADAEWPISLLYLANLFNPLQGVFTFIIFIYPKVVAAKSKGGADITWAEAFAAAFWSKEIKRTKKPRGQPNDASRTQIVSPPEAPQTQQTPAEEEKVEDEAPQNDSFDENRESSAPGNLEENDTLSPLSSDQIQTHLPHSICSIDQRQKQFQKTVQQSESYFRDVLERIDS